MTSFKDPLLEKRGRMERFADEPQHEQYRSFDPLASVDHLRFDLQRFGVVLPETLERVRNEELSYLAEGIDRATRTTFALQRNSDGELVYFDRAEWRPYMGMLAFGAEVARNEAATDRRRQFQADWAAADITHGYRMQALVPGEQYTWCSRFPYEVAERYGSAFLQSCGLKPERQMGFLYRAYCNDDGAIILESQTVDRSDDEAFDRALAVPAADPDADLDAMLRTYDGVLAQKYGGMFYAGRRDVEIQDNVWQTLLVQRDLVDFYMSKLEALAMLDLPRYELEHLAKRRIIATWALFKKRLNGENVSYYVDDGELLDRKIERDQQLEYDSEMALQDAGKRGWLLIGCGGAVSFEAGVTSLLGGSLEQAFSAIFGSGGSAERYTFDKKMYCVVCQPVPKKDERRQWCGPCGICRNCDSRLKKSGKG